jgi:hypothetical protein
MEGHLVRTGNRIGDGKRLLGRPRRRWEDNFETDPQEFGREVVDWFAVTQDREKVLTAFDCGNEHSVSTKYGEFLD